MVIGVGRYGDHSGGGDAGGPIIVAALEVKMRGTWEYDEATTSRRLCKPAI